MSKNFLKTIESICKEIKDRKAKSTQVNGWYAHAYEDGTIRGPFHRWFRCTEVAPQYRQHVASVADDVEYAAAAMNYAPLLVEEYEKLKEKYEMLKADLILLSDDAEKY